MSKALHATITKVTSTFNGAPTDHNVAIPGFHGKPLFCHASSQNDVLTIDIDETGTNSGVVVAPAHSAHVTITVGNNVPVSFDVNPINFLGNAIVGLTVRLTPALDSAFLSIDDAPRHAQQDDIDLSYVLVQESGGNQLYRMEFIVPPLVVAADEEDTSARVIPASRSQQPGVLGPMGIATP